MTGTTISHYRIVSELGKGGMGVVYRAEDTKLDRTVALKLLAPHMLASEADRARFYREARAAAALHHPNIATVFEIDETEDGRPFIAMEFIEGAQLDEGLSDKPLPVERAVAIASQIAEALKAAHERGIVHRDIKSANVMLTKEGTAKVLDFGLAKTDASTKLTQMGSTVGTIAYMSPEQARGEEVDHRTDLWSLGAVLYEMLTGQLPFPGAYEQAVVYGILNGEPEPVTGLRSGIPMTLEQVVAKCLRKEARHRYQTAADLLADLESIDAGVSRTITLPAQPAVRRSAIAPWALIVLGVLVGAAVVGAVSAVLGLNPEAPPDRHPIRFSIPTGDILPVDVDVSSDGRYLAYTGVDTTSGDQQVLLHDLASGSTISVPRSAGGRKPIISPDSRTLVFNNNGALLKYPLEGGDAVEFVSEGFNAEWLGSSAVAFNTRDLQLRFADLTGVIGDALMAADSTRGHRNMLIFGPARSRSQALVAALSLGGITTEVSLGNFPAGAYTGLRIGEIFDDPLASHVGRHHVLLSTSVSGSRQHFVQAIDSNWEPTGQPVKIPEDLSSNPSASLTGHLAWPSGATTNDLQVFSLRVPTRELAKIEVDASSAALSVDGRYVATVLDSDIVIHDLETDSRSRLSPGLGALRSPSISWSAPGDYLFVNDSGGIPWKVSRADGRTSRIPVSALQLAVSASSRDGSLLSLSPTLPTSEITLVSLEDSSETKIELGAGRVRGLGFSNDARFLITWTVARTVLIRQIDSGQEWTIPDTRTAVLSHGGDFLYTFRISSESIYKLPVSFASGLELGEEELVAHLPGHEVWDMEISPDSERLVLSSRVRPDVKDHLIHVVLNYDQYLEQLAPSGR